MFDIPFMPWAENYMKTEIIEKSDKYLFLVSNQEIWMQIVTNNYRAICLKNDEDIEKFIEYMQEIEFKGTNRSDYTYVIACDTKKANDRLKEYLESDSILKFHEGWQLFKNKEYLEKSDYNSELVEILQSVIKRYEPEETQLLLDEFHFMKEGKSGEAGANGAFDSKIRKHLLQHNDIFVCAYPYIYENGAYQPDYNGTKLKAIIEKYLYPKYQKNNVIRQIYNLIIDTDAVQRSFENLNQYPETYINFQDCMLDVGTMKEIPHSPDFYAINQLPFEWRKIKAAKEGTEIEKFFNFIFTSPDDRKMVLEYVGLCFTKDTRQQRFLTLCGLGGTGKSILIRLIETATGRENISNVSLQELSKRFSTSLLVGKLLNSCADLSAEMLEDSSVMKKLLGEDLLLAERKGEQAFMYRNYSKLLFSTNSLPVIAGERTNGFYRRLMIFRMDKQPERVDTELFAKLSAELPYFIKLAVEALHDMYARGGHITISEGSKEAVRQMWKDSDVVQAWLDDCCTLDSEEKTDRAKAFSDFEKYCENEERQAMSKNGFYKALRNKNFAEIKLHGYSHIKGLKLGKETSPKNSPKTSPDGFIEVSQEDLDSLPFT